MNKQQNNLNKIMDIINIQMKIVNMMKQKDNILSFGQNHKFNFFLLNKYFWLNRIRYYSIKVIDHDIMKFILNNVHILFVCYKILGNKNKEKDKKKNPGQG